MDYKIVYTRIDTVNGVKVSSTVYDFGQFGEITVVAYNHRTGCTAYGTALRGIYGWWQKGIRHDLPESIVASRFLSNEVHVCL